METFFTSLGRSVRARWQAVNFSLPAFPEIARAALEEHPPSAEVDAAELIRGFLLDDEQPFQTASGFGQPELVVYDDPRFYIQVLFWMDGTTQIHQHEFSGAFHVMAGSSLHAEFAFDNARAVSAHFRVGDLRLTKTELLETGRTVPIISGGACIHSLFHLDTPSITVVVRTHSDPGTGPQFTYLPPHVAVDPFFTDVLTTRRLQLLDVLEQTGEEDYADLVGRMVAELDFERGFFVLQHACAALRDAGAWDATLAKFTGKHGELAGLVPPTLEHLAWRDRLVGLRGTVTDPDHRFFLALLLNVPTRERILEFIAQRGGEDPVEAVLRWATELAEPADDATWILDAAFDGDEEAAIATLRRILSREETGDVTFMQSSLRALAA